MSSCVSDYNKNPQKALELLLLSTTSIIEDYLKNPESEANKGLLKTCMEHNNLFIQKIGNIKCDPKIKVFAKKISSCLTSSDYKGLYSKEGVFNLLKGYGYPIKNDDLSNDNWKEIYDILTVV